MGDTTEVGCNCDANPVDTTLPTSAFQAPAAGLIAVGVLLFFATFLGCTGELIVLMLQTWDFKCILDVKSSQGQSKKIKRR